MNKIKIKRAIVTLAACLLIVSSLVVEASLIGFYYKQTGTIGDVKAAITMTDQNGIKVLPWEDPVTIGTLYAGETYIHPGVPQFYTITLDSAYPALGLSVYIDVVVTESGSGNGEGLTVEVWDVDLGEVIDSGGQIDLSPGVPVNFEIHVTAAPNINADSTYGYTLTMDWNES